MSKIRTGGVTIDTTETYTYKGAELLGLLNVSFEKGYEKGRREIRQMTYDEKEKIRAEKEEIREEAYEEGYESGAGDLLELKTLLRRILGVEDEE